MVEAGTIGALSKVMEVGAMDSVLALVAAALRCLTQAALPAETQAKEGTGGVSGFGEGAGGKGDAPIPFLRVEHFLSEAPRLVPL